jgi:hypothetical protein
MAHFSLNEGIMIINGKPFSLNSFNIETGVDFKYKDDVRGATTAGMDGKVGVRTINASKIGMVTFDIDRNSTDGRLLYGMFLANTVMNVFYRDSGQTLDLSSITNGVFTKFGEKQYKNNDGKALYMNVEIEGNYIFTI